MAFKCNIGLHSWKGCKCTDCGKIRDDQHDWSNDCGKCSICGKTRDVQHNWSESDCGCCTICAKINLQNHIWDKNNCNICIKCSKIFTNNHNWDGNNCKKCGANKGQETLNMLQSKLLREHSWTGINHLVEDLGRIKYEPAFKTILDLLKDPDESIRVCAVDVLGWYNDIRALEPLLKTLLDPEKIVVDYAIMSIKKLGDERFGRLKEIVKDEDFNITIRGHAIQMLSDTKNYEFFQPICDALFSKHRYIRMITLCMLCDYDYNKDIVNILDEAYKNEIMMYNNSNKTNDKYYDFYDYRKTYNDYRKKKGLELYA